MSEIDQEITEAIFESTKKCGQNESLAKKLLAWFTALAVGNESETAESRESVKKYMDILLDDIEIDSNGNGDQ